MKFKMPKMKTITGKGLPAVGGAIASGFVKNLGGKLLTKVAPNATKWVPAVPFLVGVMLTENKGWMEYAGIGMMSSSGKELASIVIPGISGIEDMDLTGVFEENVSDDLNDNDNDESTGGPLDGSIDGADDNYHEDY